MCLLHYNDVQQLGIFPRQHFCAFAHFFLPLFDHNNDNSKALWARRPAASDDDQLRLLGSKKKTVRLSTPTVSIVGINSYVLNQTAATQLQIFLSFFLFPGCTLMHNHCDQLPPLSSMTASYSVLLGGSWAASRISIHVGCAEMLMTP